MGEVGLPSRGRGGRFLLCWAVVMPLGVEGGDPFVTASQSPTREARVIDPLVKRKSKEWVNE